MNNYFRFLFSTVVVFMSRACAGVLLLVIVLPAVSIAQGAGETLYWNGPASAGATWDDQSKWVYLDGSAAGRIPNENDVVVFRNDHQKNIRISGDYACKKIIVQMKNASQSYRVRLQVRNRDWLGDPGGHIVFEVKEGIEIENLPASGFDSNVVVVVLNESTFKTTDFTQDGQVILEELRLWDHVSVVELHPEENTILPKPRNRSSDTSNSFNGDYDNLRIFPVSPVTVALDGDIRIRKELKTNSNVNFTLSPNKMKLSQNWVSGGAEVTSGTVELSEGEVQELQNVAGLHDLTLTKIGESVNFTSETPVNGTLTTSGSQSITGVLDLKGNWTGGNVTISGGEVKLSGASNQSIQNVTSVPKLSLEKTGGSLSFSNVTVADELSGTGAFDWTGTLGLEGVWSGPTSIGSGTLKLSGSSNQNLTGLSTVPSLELAKTGGTLSLATLNVNTSLSTSGTAGWSGTLKLLGNWIGGSTTVSSSDIVFAGTSDQTTQSALTLNGVTVEKTAGKISIGADVTVLGTLTTDSNSNFDLGSNALELRSNWQGNSGTIESDGESGSVNFTQGVAQVISGKHVIPYVTLNKSDTINTLTLSDNFIVTKMLKLEKGKIVTNDKLRLYADENGYAIIPAITAPADVSLDGDIKVDRYIGQPGDSRSAGWMRFGATVSNMSFMDWANSFGIYMNPGSGVSSVKTFDEEKYGDYREGDNTSVYWIPQTNINGEILSGIGYAVYMYSSAIENGTISFTEKGTLPKGDISISTQYSASPYTYGYNLMSNPYPCPISWNELLNLQDNNGELWDNKAYVWDSQNSRYRFLVTNNGSGTNSLKITNYTNSGRLIDTDLNIAPGQAFFIFNNSGGSGTQHDFVFKESAKVKVHDRPLYRKAVDAPKPDGNFEGIAMTLEKGEQFSPIALDFSDESKSDFGLNEDIFQLGGQDVYLAARVKSTGRDGNLDKKVNARFSSQPFPEADTLINLSFSAKKSGKHKLLFNEARKFKNSRKIFLEDKYAEKTINLLKTDSYEFEVEEDHPESKATDRFSVRLGNKSVMNKVLVRGAKGLFGGQGRLVNVPVLVRDFKKMTDFELGLSWDISTLEFKKISKKISGNFTLDESKVQEGNLEFEWSSKKEKGMTLKENDTLMVIDFRIAKNSSGITDIHVTKAKGHGLALVSDEKSEAPVSFENLGLILKPIVLVKGKVSVVGGYSPETIDWKWSISGVGEGVVSGSGDFELEPLEGEVVRVEGEVKETSVRPSVLDLILARRHVLGVKYLSEPIDRFAADMDGNDIVSTKDIAQIRKDILGVEDPEDNRWMIFPESEISKIEDGHFSRVEENFEMTMGNIPVDLGFVALRKGVIPNGKSPRMSSGDVSLEIAETLIDEDGKLKVKLSFGSEAQLTGAQMAFSWKDANLEKVENDRGGSLNFEKFESNRLGIVWTEKEVGYNYGKAFVTLTFDGAQNQEELDLSIESGAMPSLVTDSNLSVLSLNTDLLSVSDPLPEKGVAVGPSPFEEQLKIRIWGHKGQTAKISLYDRSGKMVARREVVLDSESHTAILNAETVAKWPLSVGVYIYRIKIGGSEYNGKVMAK
ncbi:hypothetical protein FUAX_15460 [Fulvitalea axinellae]|uniref:Por secretion system C-terminal sorting domain-containing protein n=1 Tax=Fulvitalea axinellae TaxID=1182444 RepID=A0AAU9CRP5_9BACT|nr:hypothetical protein FUAX_15460 [Fulvitalea axinellae]